LVARESEEGINWDAAIGYDSANGPAEGNDVEKSDNPSPDEHQEEDSDHHSGGSSEENKYESDGDKDV
jgi:hypothetical protein